MMAPFDLSFEVNSRHRPFALIAPGFVGVEHQVGGSDGLERSEYSPPAPFLGIELEVHDPGAGVMLGLASATGDHLLGFYDPASGRAGIEVRTDGEVTELATAEVPGQGQGLTLAFVLCENRATLLHRLGGVVGEFDGWQPLVTEREKVSQRMDLRDPAVLGRFTVSWGTRPGGTGRLGVGRSGVFGMTGLRDIHLVQHADGRPYCRDGRMYVTASCAGLGFFQQAHWGVFSFAPERPDELTQTAQLFTRRDGVVLGDHAGQLVHDGERWLVATSSWGDFTPERGVHVRHVSTSDDLLSGIHLLETERTPLPTTDSSWDPALTRVGGRWHVAFVESPSQEPFDFHPALAVTEAEEWTEGLTMVGAATDMHQCEGPILMQVEDRWWLLASDGHGRECPVFDLEMRRVGTLDAPYGSNIPHPQIFTIPDGRWALMTFDGTPFGESVMGYGTHGHVIVMRRRTRPGPGARLLRSGRGARLVNGLRRLRHRAS